MQEVFARHFDSYAQGKRLHSRELSAAQGIRTCYTAERGGHLEYCAQGHMQREVFHACRHRSCPRCAKGPRQAWVQAELERLLPCPHFHAVFTVPHELLALWEYNRQAFSKLLFDSVRLSLLEMLGDPRHLGATPGLLLSLHTWGRTLSHHPHIHALVSAGGVNAKGQWCATRAGYLLPLKPLQKLFSGKLLGGLCEALGTWSLPPRQDLLHWQRELKLLYRKHWNIQLNAPYSQGRGVALYLARYAKGGPLPADRPLQLNASRVSFGYTDHRDGRVKGMRLPVHEFIARVLWHAPPKGVHTVRHAGLYASARAGKQGAAALGLACAQLAGPAQSTPGVLLLEPLSAPTPVLSPPRAQCPTCSRPLLRAYSRPPAGPRNQISLLGRGSSKNPSLDGQTPRPNPPFKRSATAGTSKPPRQRQLRPLYSA